MKKVFWGLGLILALGIFLTSGLGFMDQPTGVAEFVPIGTHSTVVG